ncbi:MAG TPA: HRDC domain-containing protein [Planctomycetota bacterium]|nr:HRDC domain-containing protein [Planctomycetota bacterium]
MNHPASVPLRYVDTAQALHELVARLHGAGRIALDTEADSLHSYYEKVCLIQLATEDDICLVDPLAGLDLSGLLEVLARTPLLFHGADYDLRMLRASLGFRPRGEVHDTLIAAQVIGFEEVGLATLAQRFCGVTLTKSSRKADWSRRPLTPAQLAYAADDVRYLAPIADALLEEVRRLGRYHWYRESCERMVEATARDRARDPEDAWRIKGLKGLGRQQLAFVRELWRWRESEAQRTDRPPFMVLGNAQLRDLAVWATAHPTASLSHGPKLPRNCRGRRLRALERALEHARRLPQSEWPRTRPAPRPNRRPGGSKQAVNTLMAECARIAADLGLSPPLLASRAALEAIVARRPRSASDILACSAMLPWQVELLAPTILKVLATGTAKE